MPGSSAVLLIVVFAFASYSIHAGETTRGERAAAASRADETGSAVLTPQFRSLDKDGDGVLSKKETYSYPRATAGDFERADMDKDEKLTFEEFKVLHANTSEDRRLGSK